MSAATRMKWLYDTPEGYAKSSCGRFIIRSFCMDTKHSGYWGLTDTKRGTEYPCRTLDSAQTAARNLLRNS